MRPYSVGAKNITLWYSLLFQHEADKLNVGDIGVDTMGKWTKQFLWWYDYHKDGSF